MNRLERIKSYCCIGLFSSVEEAEGDEKVMINFTRSFQGESAWYIKVPGEVVGGGNLISYCPWCGTQLPKSPYIERGK